MGKTIIVSNRLPVKISRGENGFDMKASEGGLATGLGSIYKDGDNVWIGWPGTEIKAEHEQQEVTQKLAAINLQPVFLTENEINMYYEGFSNEVLWPVFHYFPSYAQYDENYWNCYQKVNDKFKEAVMKVLDTGDTVWVHDYQLLLLPNLIRKEMPDVTIGFFQHIPFPSFELFRLIPWRAELLEGMLGSDLIGFHTYDDTRHFLNSATRLLPLHSTSNMVNVNERSVVIESFPMGIDNKKFEEMSTDPKVLEEMTSLKESCGPSVKIILSIDRLDYSKGILQRLYAIDLLLSKNPEYIEKIVLHMIIVPSRDNVPHYKDLRDEIDRTVGNINSRYRTINWNPIRYFYRSFPAETLSALYSSSEICLVSPMRDGMNLVCKEYIASRTNYDGVLILSEMAGAAKELIEALIVNPNNIGEIYRAIIEALNMPREEQERRMRQLREVVSKFNINHWVKIYMDSLRSVKHYQQSLQTKHAAGAIRKQIEDRYANAKKRIIFLDYDGTLVGFHSNAALATPDEDLFTLLRKLSNDPANTVVVISGRDYRNLEKWFGELPLDLIAEHGAWQKKYSDEWCKSTTLTNSWKADVFPILETFTDRTPGSYIEEKNYSLVWHYRRVQVGLGELRANELMNNLRYFTADKGLQLLPGNKIVEIKNVEINKGKAALSWLEGHDYDFIMSLGDDNTDEDIFKALPQESITIKVGSTISAATYFLHDHKEVRQLLKGLTENQATISQHL